jgi:DHA2 family methylenomycin A resistance protein-like MFS transporter
MSPRAGGRSAISPLGWTVAATSLGLMVAMPAMGGTFGTQVAGQQWIVDAYTLVFASLLLSAGAIADQVGCRRAFAAGFKLFAVASVMCALAPSHGVLIAARVLQGAGAALIIPTSLALIAQACGPDAAARSRSIGARSAAGGVVSAAGPFIGGLLMQSWGWRSIFLINLPICAGALWLMSRHIPADAPAEGRRPDVAGVVAVTVALAGATAGLIEAGAHGWTSSTALAGFAAAMLGGLAFAWTQAHAADPVLPLALFRQRAFSTVMVVAIATNLAFYGAIFILSIYFQQARGYSPARTGLALLPFAVIMFANIASGRACARWSPRMPVVSGLVISALGYAVLAQLGERTPYLAVLPGLFMMAIGAGLVVPAMTSCLLAEVDKHRSATASAALSSARQVGAAVGVAWLGAFAAGGSPQIALGAARAFELIAMGLWATVLLAAWGLRPRRVIPHEGVLE